mgnify:CR=1 FL=1
MTDPTLTPKSSGTYWGTAVADIQSGLSVSGGKITGTLKYYDDATKALVQDWGEGYFIAVGFSNYSSGLTYANCEVGIVPTQGAGLVHLDSDQDAVLKVTSPDQKIVTIQTDANGHKRATYWSLKDITYAPKA